jgi:hypothetical protein
LKVTDEKRKCHGTGALGFLCFFWIRIPATLHVSFFSCPDLASREPMVEGGIYQWSGLEKLTKWDIVQLISQQAGLREQQRFAAFRSIPSLNKIQGLLPLITLQKWQVVATY